MADTTNDIWNDNDGEEDEAPRKGGRLRRFGIFFLVLAAVLLVLTRWCKPTKGLHPIVFILASAIIGVVFSF